MAPTPPPKSVQNVAPLPLSSSRKTIDDPVCDCSHALMAAVTSTWYVRLGSGGCLPRLSVRAGGLRGGVVVVGGRERAALGREPRDVYRVARVAFRCSKGQDRLRNLRARAKVSKVEGEDSLGIFADRHRRGGAVPVRIPGELRPEVVPGSIGVQIRSRTRVENRDVGGPIRYELREQAPTLALLRGRADSSVCPPGRRPTSALPVPRKSLRHEFSPFLSKSTELVPRILPGAVRHTACKMC